MGTVVHFGIEQSPKVIVLTLCGHGIRDCGASVPELNDALLQNDLDAIVVSESAESGSADVIKLSRSLTTAPLILFQGANQKYEPQDFDLIIPYETHSATWLDSVERLIEESRRVRAHADVVEGTAARLRQDSALLQEESALLQEEFAVLLQEYICLQQHSESVLNQNVEQQNNTALVADHSGIARNVILVIDDDAPVRKLLKVLLAESNYTVLTAASGAAGIEIFRKYRGSIGLIILDMIMPWMGGRETYDELRAIGLSCPVLVCSGFSKSGEIEEMVKLGIAGVLQKPVKTDEFCNTVAVLLSKAPS
jgi:CheY-like chemotaxis protein